MSLPSGVSVPSGVSLSGMSVLSGVLLLPSDSEGGGLFCPSTAVEVDHWRSMQRSELSLTRPV